MGKKGRPLSRGRHGISLSLSSLDNILAEAHQDSGDLGAVGGVLRAEGRGGGAGDEPGADGPAQGVAGVGADTRVVIVAGDVSAEVVL